MNHSSDTADDDPAVLRAEVTGIVNSPEFARSAMMGRLLAFLCEAQLAGGPPLKAYTIAVEALGRSPDFDAQIDSYPRVMVGRLRAMMERYYSNRDRDSVRIVIPSGQYGIVIVRPEPVAPPGHRVPGDKDANLLLKERQRPRTTERWLAWALVTAVAIAAAAVLAVSLWPARPASEPLALAPMLVLSAPRTDGSMAARSVALLIDDRWREGFSRFGTVRVVGRGTSPVLTGDTATYRLDTSIAGDGARAIVVVTLDRMRTAAGDEQTIWSTRFPVPHDPAASAEMNRSFSSIAGGLGIIVSDQRQPSDAVLADGNPCIVAFHQWRIGRARAEIPRVRECLDRSIAARPDDIEALSVSSFLNLIEGEMTANPALIARGHRQAVTAYRADPLNSDALMASARSRFYYGQCQAGQRLADRAVAANPLDSDIASFTGAYLAACDDPRAEPALRRASDLSGPSGTVAAGALALFLVRHDRADEAEAAIEPIAPTIGAETQFQLIRLLAAAARGDLGRARAGWASIAHRYKLSDQSDPDQIIRQFQTLPLLRVKMIAELRRRGVIGQANPAEG